MSSKLQGKYKFVPFLYGSKFPVFKGDISDVDKH